jgi:formamidopyrimidine-DNA glycosylase
MPEIPDLEAIRGFLEPRLRGNPVTDAEAALPWLVRTGADGMRTLAGHEFVAAHRRGKFLLFPTDDGRVLVVNPMLTGRFQWALPQERRRGRTAVQLSFADGHQLRYWDERRMGRIYLVPIEELPGVPQMAELGPDALEIDEAAFLERLRAKRGQLKSVLTSQEFIAGIGNAYADEILWEAQLHPHRKAATLSDEERRRLYRAIRSTLEWAIPILEAEVRERLDQRKEEWRAHLRVHRRQGEACPRCGERIGGQERAGRETNYCVRCQPLFETARAAGGDAG